MTFEAEADNGQRWVLVVRRSFGIPDDVGDEDARSALVGLFEEQLREQGWQRSTREVADPMVDALMAMGPAGELDDQLSTGAQRGPTLGSGDLDAARRLVERGISEIDPEDLEIDVTDGYPPEIVAAAALVLDQVVRYANEHSSGH